MKYKQLAFVLMVLFGTSCARNTPDFSEKIWYQQPAADWFEALPLGNGRLGAMVFGGVSNEHLQLNEESLWAGCPENPYPEDISKHYARFQQLNLEEKYKEALSYAMENLTVTPTSIRSYEPLGNIYLNFDHEHAEDYKRSLDLESGITNIEYKINGKRFKRESFISVKYDAIFYRFESLDGEVTNCSVRYKRFKDTQQTISDNRITISGQIFDDPEGFDDNPGGSGKGGYHMKFATLVDVKTDDGSISSTDSLLTINGASSFTLVVGAATDYNLHKLNFDRTIEPLQKAEVIMKKAMAVSYSDAKMEHVKQHSEIYNRVKLDISGIDNDTIPTNKRIEAQRNGADDPYLAQLLFQYGRYLLMSSSGGKATLPANLQGIWSKEEWAAWEADFHLNINLQMNYWAADVCNLSETFEPLSNYMVELAKSGKITASNFLGSKGWVAHHVANPFGRTTPSGSTTGSQVNNGYCFPLAGAWMSLSLWRHYTYNNSLEYLEETAYPVLSGAARFVLDFLKEDANGMLVTAPSYSPENTYIHPETGNRLKNTVAASVDMQIIRDLFSACIEAEKILGKKYLTEELEYALPKLPAIKIGNDGTIQEWREDYVEAEPGHRHISHLFALHPSNQITRQTPELFEAAEKTLQKRLSSGGGQTGWSRAWIVNFYARLFNGEECNKHINSLLRTQITNNLFDLHPPHVFQIDGNLGVTAGIAEMLLQSHCHEEIHLLPALPMAWKDGHVHGLKARGGYTVNMEWKNSLLYKAEIKGKPNSIGKIKYGENVQDFEIPESGILKLNM